MKARVFLLRWVVFLGVIASCLAVHAETYNLLDDLGFWLKYRYQTLEQKELTNFIDQKGFEGARFFFSDLDRWLTFDLREYLHDWHVKVSLLSLKYRDLKHRPDPLAAKVIKEYQECLVRGEKVMPRVVVDKRNKELIYRYFIPIYTKKSCLRCHGNKYQLIPSYATKIKAFYPEDRAVGLKEGDLRGVISIDIPAQSVRYLVSSQ